MIADQARLFALTAASEKCARVFVCGELTEIVWLGAGAPVLERSQRLIDMGWRPLGLLGVLKEGGVGFVLDEDTAANFERMETIGERVRQERRNAGFEKFMDSLLKTGGEPQV